MPKFPLGPNSNMMIPCGLEIIYNYIIMETATLVAIFLSGLLVSFTGYALYTAFGQPSQQLRDRSNGV